MGRVQLASYCTYCRNLNTGMVVKTYVMYLVENYNDKFAVEKGQRILYSGK